MLMFMGAMAGSTGGGIKTVRIVIVFKAIRREIDKILHPRRVKSVKIDGNVVEDFYVDTLHDSGRDLKTYLQKYRPE